MKFNALTFQIDAQMQDDLAEVWRADFRRRHTSVRQEFKRHRETVATVKFSMFDLETEGQSIEDLTKNRKEDLFCEQTKALPKWRQ